LRTKEIDNMAILAKARKRARTNNLLALDKKEEVR